MTQYQPIAISDIDLSDQTYRVTRAPEDLSALTLSISAQGMIIPLKVIEKAQQRGRGYTLVSGFRRIEAARSLGQSQVRCQIYPAGEAAACARMAVAENAFCRNLGPGELARAVVLVSRHMDAAALAEHSLQIFNTRLNPKFVETLIFLGRLNESIFHLMDSGQLAIKAARVLATMPEQDAQMMLGLFSCVKASSGKQMEIFTWAREICAREKIRLDQLLNDSQIRAALDPNKSNQDLGAAANRVRAVLYARRFPQLEAARTRATGLVRDLGLPRTMRMTLPENFESMVYSLLVSFTSPEDYAKSLEVLTRLAAHPAFHQLLDRQGPFK